MFRAEQDIGHAHGIVKLLSETRAVPWRMRPRRNVRWDTTSKNGANEEKEVILGPRE